MHEQHENFFHPPPYPQPAVPHVSPVTRHPSLREGGRGAMSYTGRHFQDHGRMSTVAWNGARVTVFERITPAVDSGTIPAVMAAA